VSSSSSSILAKGKKRELEKRSEKKLLPFHTYLLRNTERKGATALSIIPPSSPEREVGGKGTGSVPYKD